MRYKLIYFYFDVYVWEFYDLKKYTSELKNFVGYKKHKAIINKMKWNYMN